MQVVFIGPPGAGKGTQCEKLLNHLGAVHISTGQLLRDEIERETEIGRQVEACIAQGELAPDHLVLEILRGRLKQVRAGRSVLFDGFPRTVTQAKGLDELLRETGRPLNAALELRVPDEEIIQRLAGRGRADDSPETIRIRLEVFFRQTGPVSGYYRERNLWHEIDGMGTAEEVFARIRKCLTACEQKAG